MGDIIGMTEFKAKKARIANASQFGPIAAGIVKPGSKRAESKELRQHEDEAIALGNSWRDKDKK